ncbi:MAG: DMT family transporter [Desulfovibrionaceae bacterium]|nr:DMT family transporter [Desulfovibrionaceae bacterium]
MPCSSRLIGHILALCTITLWGLTFVSTKVLLVDLLPVEVLFLRFCIGFVALFLIAPRFFAWQGWRFELLCMGAGLCGVTLYFLLENTALTYTYASNVGVIVSIAPFATALLAHFFVRGEGLSRLFFVGFLLAMSGVSLISFNGNVSLHLNPLGDILAAGAACIWAVYCTLMCYIAKAAQPMILCTRRVFWYGLLSIAPLLPFLGAHFALDTLMRPVILGNLLFLGLGGSALGYVAWNYCVRALGPVATSVYIYLIPVITVLASVLILHEKLTPLAVLGIALTLVGLVLSEWKSKKSKKE